jgi:hypothetical protein
VKGSPLYATEEGKKASLKMRHHPNVTACELDGKTLFELRREGAAALRGVAELYAPEGVFIRTIEDGIGIVSSVSSGVISERGKFAILGCEIVDKPVGIHFTKVGGIGFGTKGPPNPSMQSIYIADQCKVTVRDEHRAKLLGLPKAGDTQITPPSDDNR